MGAPASALLSCVWGKDTSWPWCDSFGHSWGAEPLMMGLWGAVPLLLLGRRCLSLARGGKGFVLLPGGSCVSLLPWGWLWQGTGRAGRAEGRNTAPPLCAPGSCVHPKQGPAAASVGERAGTPGRGHEAVWLGRGWLRNARTGGGLVRGFAASLLECAAVQRAQEGISSWFPFGCTAPSPRCWRLPMPEAECREPQGATSHPCGAVEHSGVTRVLQSCCAGHCGHRPCCASFWPSPEEGLCCGLRAGARENRAAFRVLPAREAAALDSSALGC